ncbi:exonuclease, partial [Pseudomonas aeruginosa]
MQIIREIEQGSEEWLRLRLGIVTCSEVDLLMVKGKGE